MIFEKTNTNKISSDTMVFNDEYATKILLIRHGESLGNAVRRFLGHTDLDLSALGYEQAEKTAELLSTVKIDKVYSSSLIRAYNTALPHARLRGLPVIPSDELRELYAGDWEGMYVDDIIARFGDTYLIDWREYFGTFTVPRGENMQELANRIYNEVLRIAKENEGKTLLIGTHAAALRSFWGKITKTYPEKLASVYPFPSNASVSVVYFDGNELIPGEYSYSKHLEN